MSKNKMLALLCLIVNSQVCFSSSIEKPARPISAEIYTICDLVYCNTSVVLKNNTAFEIKVISNYFDETHFTEHAFNFYKAKDVYATNNPFDNPLLFQNVEFTKLKEDAIFKPLEVKIYTTLIKRDRLNFEKGTEYVVYAADMYTRYIINGNQSTIRSLHSKFGIVDDLLTLPDD
ncbi:hypothetical protein HH219_03570 [Pseudoalteromonas sp. NEC-BIFX-2020_015]|uniref:hypothetical protein n=1 Tax=Pseudoalteromonas sp. NEC-BIFX-2020_015 TaxID=2729544 RepID=UPI0014615E50|nr:hypothetical protein [Pseudoalteromonas sp. NEC-BIFX-2020_015]NMR24635.1 hypothetical protein [Pseudoalteromonas sp. NEC-BIFX-2020_015]